MFLLKKICLIIFIIITILFTIGYATQPIVSNYSTSITPTGNTNTQNIINTNFYITSGISNTYTQNTDYTNIDNNKRLIFTTLFYMCIAISILLVCSILIGFFGLKFISKISFFITLILMILVFLVIQFTIVASSLINMTETKQFNTPETSNGTGYYLILVSTCLMLVNYIIYAILA
jgi:uncharacterized membrane protein YbjE (DUF340 family)